MVARRGRGGKIIAYTQAIKSLPIRQKPKTTSERREGGRERREREKQKKNKNKKKTEAEE